MSIVSVIKSRRTDSEMGGTSSTYRKMRNMYEIVVGKRDTYEPRGITRRRKESII